ncbi:MAG TPA: adenylate kinase [Thermomicrobiales bacterium]|nr:adenylate kinase [Thermomicrobiales bacterium]
MQSGQHVILMGAQGAGKGTQAERLAPKLGLVHFSTGEAFRAAIAQQTELGVAAKAFLDRGDLVPDDVTIGIVAAKLASIRVAASESGLGGALFDGFPRTKAQAEGLAAELKQQGESIAAVIEIAVPLDDLVERLSGRRVCSNGHVYHERFNPPQVSGVCDVDGLPLIQRADDTTEAIKRRLDLYFELTTPLLEYYQDLGLLHQVDGLQSIDRVEAEILAVLDQYT